ncbi:MAG: ORF6N domain-containing protein [Myxococcales bacterium]|jgi:hypothetical protein|nr:ORF6N domain-containing protein [Myxococcales bacterium]
MAAKKATDSARRTVVAGPKAGTLGAATKGTPSESVTQRVESGILALRGHRVLLDETLAALYEVPAKRLNEQVKRNIERFPPDFMFQLTQDEVTDLRSQFATSSSWGGRRTAPYAFTEQGVAMLSSVLRSPRAVAVNIEIMRAFVRLRGLLQEHDGLKRRLTALEKKYDAQFRVVFDAIRDLMQPVLPTKRPVGFRKDER